VIGARIILQAECLMIRVTADDYPPRQYFVLTDAGKPVFIRLVLTCFVRPICTNTPILTSQTTLTNAPDPTTTLGVVQALISIFLDDGDRLRSIQSGRTRITFILRPPLYYVAVSAWGEPESVVSYLSVLLSLHPSMSWERRRGVQGQGHVHKLTRASSEDTRPSRVSAPSNPEHREPGSTQTAL
jgi:hypothetical protein